MLLSCATCRLVAISIGHLVLDNCTAGPQRFGLGWLYRWATKVSERCARASMCKHTGQTNSETQNRQKDPTNDNSAGTEQKWLRVTGTLATRKSSVISVCDSLFWLSFVGWGCFVTINTIKITRPEKLIPAIDWLESCNLLLRRPLKTTFDMPWFSVGCLAYLCCSFNSKRDVWHPVFVASDREVATEDHSVKGELSGP